MKTIFQILPAIFISVGAMGQNYNDAIIFNQCDYSGTARSQAMGSAFGALGADLTSQSINPAGLAAYRATEIGMSLGVNINKTHSNYYGFNNEDDKISVPFNNIGASFLFGNTLRENSTGIIGHNFSIAYSRLADYNRNAKYSDLYGHNSMLDYFCFDDVINDKFSGLMAKDAGWISEPYDDQDAHISFYTNVWEEPYGENMLDKNARQDTNGDGLVDHIQHIKERGYKGETCFSYAMNISNKVYWGASIGIVTLRHREKMIHYEDYYGTPFNSAYEYFTYTTDLDDEGSGVNFKTGVIVNPINALRIGVAIHSPSFLKISERYKSTITGANYDEIYYSPYGEYNYNYRTPGKIIGSLAGVIGNYAIISFDYETSDYAKGKFKDDDGNSNQQYDDINNQLKLTLKRVHTFRFGVEGRIAEIIYLRGGYNMQTSPYKSNILINSYKHNAISGGIGYRYNNFFIDATYVCRSDKGDRWVLPDSNIPYSYENNIPASIKTKSHNITVSVGFRF